MNTIDRSSPILVHSPTRHPDAGHANRLIVLIPAYTEYKFAARRILDLALASGTDVLFLGLCTDSSDALSLRRELIALSASFEDARVHAETTVETGPNWVHIVKSNCRSGDRIVCLGEHRAGLLRQPLNQLLESKLDAPVYILSAPAPQRAAKSSWLSNIAVWAGLIGIIVGAFLLQIRITSLPDDWAQTTLLIGSVLAELWLIWVWNSLFG